MFLSGWSYRKQIIIAGQSGAGSDYQVLLYVGESSGSVGANLNVAGHSLSFPSAKNVSGDLRFTSDDGITLLPFWVEAVTGSTPNRTAKIWVKVAADLGSNQNIFCYYGNASASNASSGDNTFIFFDDFEGSALDTSKWTKTSPDTGATSVDETIISSSVLTLNLKASSWTGASRKITANNAFNLANKEFVAYAKSNWGGYGSGSYWRSWQLPAVWNVKGFSHGAGETGITISNSNNAGSVSSGRIDTSDAYTDYAIRSYSCGSQFKFKKNGTQIYATSSYVPNTDEYPTFWIWNWSNNNALTTLNVDYVYLKKFVDTEPAFSSVGMEEVATTDYTLTLTDSLLISENTKKTAGISKNETFSLSEVLTKTGGFFRSIIDTLNIIDGGITQQGANSPAAAVIDSTIGNVGWEYGVPENAELSDNVYVGAYAGDELHDVVDEHLKIVKSDGSIGTTDKADNLTPWPSVDTYVSYGNNDDLWGEEWTAADINSANFGVVFSPRTIQDGETIKYLKVTNFGFSIPAIAIINGIKVEIEKKQEYYISGGSWMKAWVDHIRITIYYSLNGIKKSVSLSKNDNLSISENTKKDFATIKSETFSISEFIDAIIVILGYFINVSDGINLSDNIKKDITSIKKEVIAIAENTTKSIGRFFSEAINTIETLIKKTGKKIDETLGISDIFNRLAEYKRNLEENLLIAEDFIKSLVFIRTFTENINITEAIKKSISRTISELHKITEDIIKKGLFYLNITETIILTENFYKQTKKTIDEAMSITENLIKSFGKKISETILTTEYFTRIFIINLFFIENIILTDNIYKSLNKNIKEIIGIIDKLDKSITIYFRENIKTIENITKRFGRIFYDTSSINDIIRKRVEKDNKEAIYLAETLKKDITATKEENITITEVIKRYKNGIEQIWNSIKRITTTNWAKKSRTVSTDWTKKTRTTTTNWAKRKKPWQL